MRALLLILFIILGIDCYAQIPESENSKTVTYYKKFVSYQTVSKKRAKFKNEIFDLGNGRTKVEYTEIKSGTLRWVRFFDGSEPVGIWEEFDEDGKLINSRNLDSIPYCKEKYPKLNIAEDSNFTNAEFVGGESKMYSYLGKEMKYPPYAYQNDMSLRVKVQFIIEKDGEVTGVCIELNDKKTNKLIEYEAIRVISLMPNWIPGEEQGEKVRVRYSLPITFSTH